MATSDTESPPPAPRDPSNSSKVNLGRLSRACEAGNLGDGSSDCGMPHGLDESSARPIAWLLLTDILPPMPDRWRSVLEDLDCRYWRLVGELLEEESWWSEPKWLESGCFDPAVDCSDVFSALSDPCGPHQSLAAEIHKDVLRTHPTVPFFASSPNCRKRHMSLFRVLYVWSRLNQGVRYVQGMNEVAGVFYLVLGNEGKWIKELGLKEDEVRQRAAEQHLAQLRVGRGLALLFRCEKFYLDVMHQHGCCWREPAALLQIR